jgi:hypothetical protein
MAEVRFMGLVEHQNLIKLVAYCVHPDVGCAQFKRAHLSTYGTAG